MNNTRSNILILGSSTKACVYVTKQLKKYGLNVTVVDWIDSPVKYSKYIDRFVRVPSPLDDLELFINTFIDIITQQAFDCLLPIHDAAIEICSKYKTQISKHCKIIGLNEESVQNYARNKSMLCELAEKVGLKVPKGILITNLAGLENAINDCSFPCVVKPVQSAIIKNNRIYLFKVTIVNTKEEVVDLVRENIKNTNILLQEYIEGYGIGYNIFSKNGKVLNSYIHRRINESSGVSSYRESLPPNEYNFKKQADMLVSKIGWDGAAMIEFKIHNGVAFLMEINGRFWGSIEVAIRSGLNYPVMLYESQFLERNIPSDIPIKLVRVRNLKDEVLIYTNMLFQKGGVKVFIQWFASLFNAFKKNNYIEDSLFDNPVFVIATYLYEIKRVYTKALTKVKIRFVHIKTPSIDGNKRYSIAFVCTGNICRSPFSEYYAKKVNTQHSFRSFGTSNLSNRLPPMNAVIAGSSFGVDLSSFESNSLNQVEPNSIDLFIVFDKLNYYALLKKNIDRTKIFFLAKDPILDPYKKNQDYFKRQYSIIQHRIDQLFSTK